VPNGHQLVRRTRSGFEGENAASRLLASRESFANGEIALLSRLPEAVLPSAFRRFPTVNQDMPVFREKSSEKFSG
jgi:hypothetical protein